MNCKIIKFKKFSNHTGSLLPITFDKKFPMQVKRIFFIYGKKKFIRGDHAHKKCHQFLYPVFGKFQITLKYRGKKKIFNLDHKQNYGIYLPPMIWCKVKFKNNDSTILVLASHKYEFNDYIENYKDFLKYEKKKYKK